MAQIFVSYKRVDKNKVFPIVEKIERELGCICRIRFRRQMSCAHAAAGSFSRTATV